MAASVMMLKSMNGSQIMAKATRICHLYVLLATLFGLACCSRKVGESKLPVHQDPDSMSMYSLEIYHSFDQGQSPKYSKRGTLNFRTNKQGPGLFVQTASLTAGEKRKLKDLARHDGIYRVRVPTSLEADPTDSSTKYVSSFTKACSILESRLSDDITVHVDQSSNVLGVSIVTLAGSCSGDVTVESSDLDEFNTTVSLSVTVPGPVPDTQTYIQKMEDEKRKKESGNGQDNRSFFAKYWMYIVPVVIFMLMSGGGEQK